MSQFVDFKPTAEPKYTITGPNCQILTISLDAGERVESEPGSMMFMSDFISSSARCAGFGACCSGEGCCRSVFTNNSEAREKGFIALTPNYPSKVVPVNLESIGGVLIAQAGSYMAHIGDVAVDFDLDCCSCSCCFGGLGAVRQELKGKGTVFLNAGGTVMSRVLQANETIVVDSSSVVAFQKSVDLSIKRAGGCCTICCGGEGMFNTALKGPGVVYIQSMSFERYRMSVQPTVLPGEPLA